MKESPGFCLIYTIIECYMTSDTFLSKISTQLDCIVNNSYFLIFVDLDFMIVFEFWLVINENVGRKN